MRAGVARSGVVERAGDDEMPTIDYVERCQGEEVRVSAYAGKQFVTYLYPEDLPEIAAKWQFTTRAMTKVRRLLKGGDA